MILESDTSLFCFGNKMDEDIEIDIAFIHISNQEMKPKSCDELLMDTTLTFQNLTSSMIQEFDFIQVCKDINLPFLFILCIGAKKDNLIKTSILLKA